MTDIQLEHVNLTVRDPLKTANVLNQIFGWQIRWQGDAIHQGFTVHVGGDDTYIALYKQPKQNSSETSSYERTKSEDSYSC